VTRLNASSWSFPATVSAAYRTPRTVRRVPYALQRAGGDVHHKRVLRVMRQESLLCHLQRPFMVSTDSAQGSSTYPHLLADVALTAPDQAGVADSTSVRLPTPVVYLACLLDAYSTPTRRLLDACSRRGVGWKRSRQIGQIDTRLTLDALEVALAQRHPAPELLHQSDRGLPYASLA
jgi:putative transposase